MRQGSVVLDMATEFGGNCELSEKDKTVNKFGVTIIGESNLPSMVATHASEMYSKNILSLIKHFTKEGKFELDMDDEIAKGAVITCGGKIVHPKLKEILSIS